MTHTFDVTLTAVATPHCDIVRLPVAPFDDKYMVSVVIATVTLFAEPFTIVMAVPVVNPTFELAGMVYVAAA